MIIALALYIKQQEEYTILKKKFYGTTLQEIASSLNSEQKEEIVYRTSIKYEDNQSKVQIKIWMFRMFDLYLID